MKRPHWSDNLNKHHHSSSQQMPVHTISLFFFMLGFICCLGLVLVVMGKARIAPAPMDYTVKGTR